jgi:hypothetical protein
MPNQEQKQLISQARKDINSELEEELSLLKQLQKQEKNKLKEKHHTQQENLILQKRKKFLELKEQILNDSKDESNKSP